MRSGFRLHSPERLFIENEQYLSLYRNGEKPGIYKPETIYVMKAVIVSISLCFQGNSANILAEMLHTRVHIRRV